MLIGRKYINFISKSYISKNNIIENFDLAKNIGKNGVLLFFVYQDFYKKSTEEIIELNKMYNEFLILGITPVVISVDSELTHQYLAKYLVSANLCNSIQLDFVSDISKEISRDYLVLDENESYCHPASIFIDKKGYIKYFEVGSLDIKRDIKLLLSVLKNYV